MCSQEGVLPLKTPDNDNAMQLHELRETCKQTPDCARSVPSLCVRALPAVPQHSAFLKEGRKIGKVGEVGGGWKWHGSQWSLSLPLGISGAALPLTVSQLTQ